MVCVVSHRMELVGLHLLSKTGLIAFIMRFVPNKPRPLPGNLTLLTNDIRATAIPQHLLRFPALFPPLSLQPILFHPRTIYSLIDFVLPVPPPRSIRPPRSIHQLYIALSRSWRLIRHEKGVVDGIGSHAFAESIEFSALLLPLPGP